MIVLKELAELVQACKDVKARMTPDNHKIHVDDIAATLQKIIDDEFDRSKLTFDQAIIVESIAKDNPPDPKTFCWTVTQNRIDEEAKRLEIAVGMGSDDAWSCGHDPFTSSCQGLCASPNNDEEAKPIKVPALPRRRRERSRRADRLNQSPKIDKGNA